MLVDGMSLRDVHRLGPAGKGGVLIGHLSLAPSENHVLGVLSTSRILRSLRFNSHCVSIVTAFQYQRVSMSPRFNVTALQVTASIRALRPSGHRFPSSPLQSNRPDPVPSVLCHLPPSPLCTTQAMAIWFPL